VERVDIGKVELGETARQDCCDQPKWSRIERRLVHQRQKSARQSPAIFPRSGLGDTCYSSRTCILDLLYLIEGIHL
jgi:hypothetical protein